MDTFDILKKLTRGMDNRAILKSLEDNKQQESPQRIIFDPKEFRNANEYEEALNAFRRRHRIHTYGTDVPPPVTQFDDIFAEIKGAASNLRINVSRLNFPTLTPIQMQAMPILAKGRDILACAPTGSGKTLAFLVPLIARLSEVKKLRGIHLVILAPSRELANQLLNETKKLTENLPMRCLFIRKTKGMEEKSKRKNFGKYNILISTPQRLVYLLESSKCLDFSAVEYLVLDEADKLFQAGSKSFRDQLGVINNACTNPDLKRAMFSATYAYDVEQWCKLNISDIVQVVIGQRNAAVDTVEQKLIYAGSEEGKLIGLRNLFFKGLQPPVLIFVQTKQRAADLFKELLYDGCMVASIHSNLSQPQRDRIVSAFESGKIWVLICTDLMGRGLDFKDLRVVINYDVPDSAITYIHRIGRTGRAGEKGYAYTFFTDADVPRMRSIANVVKQSGADVPEYLLKLKKLSKAKEREVFQAARQKDADSAKRRPKKRNVKRTRH